jgi:hypothetical protein
MLTAAIVLICLGLAGLVFGLAPEIWFGLVAAVVPDAATLTLPTPPQAVMAVAGAIYLSGIILLAGALLRRTAIAHFQTLTRQRADLESLQSAVLIALERLEIDHRESHRQKQLVSSEMRDLVEEFERAAVVVARADD